MNGRLFFIYANPNKKNTILAAQALAKSFLRQGCRVGMQPWLYQHLRAGEAIDLAAAHDRAEAILSLGGDGTMLRAISLSVGKQIPVLGINMGHIGFLLETDAADLDALVERLLRRAYTVESRMMLSATVNGSQTYEITNDLTLLRGDNPSCIFVDAYAGDERIFKVHGDGVLVSTPTGTTGYALSAGGPIIHPSLDCVVVVPICSHVLHHRPVVLPSDVRITLHCKGDAGRVNQVLIDGQVSLNMQGEIDIALQKSPHQARFIRFEALRFLEKLHQKQTAWSRE